MTNRILEKVNELDELENIFISNSVIFEFNEAEQHLTIGTSEKETEISGKSAKDVSLVLSFCNGENSVKSIAKKTNLPIDYINQIIDFLRQREIVTALKSEEDTDRKELKDYLLLSYDIKEIDSLINNICNKSIGIIGNKILASTLKNDLVKLFDVDVIEDIESIKDIAEKDIYILIDDFENIEKLKELNKYAQTNELKFLRVVFNKISIEIGPLFIPKATACYECFLKRIITNNSYPQIFTKYSHKLSDYPRNTNVLKSSLLLGSHLIKQQLIHYFSFSMPTTIIGQELSINIINNKIDKNLVLKVPTCTFCDSQQVY